MILNQNKFQAKNGLVSWSGRHVGINSETLYSKALDQGDIAEVKRHTYIQLPSNLPHRIG